MPAARARGAPGAGRRRVPAAPGRARPRRRVRRRRDDRDDLDELASIRSTRSRIAREREPVSGCTSTPPTPARRRSAPSCAMRFAGWERADSIVVNPHKWLLTPMDCSAIWTRRPDDLRAAFSLVPEYLRVSEDVVELLRVQPGARPPLPRAQALGGAALLRPRGAAGADPRGDSPRRAVRGVGRATSRAGS